MLSTPESRNDRSTSRPIVSVADGPAFAWRDHGRFVELHAVQTGWLVLWGRHDPQGRRRLLAGNRTYPDLDGARRRIADAVAELTGRPASAAEALLLLGRAALPAHRPEPPPDPL